MGPHHRRPAARPRDPPGHPAQEGGAASPSKAPDDVLTYIATHITNNIRELEGALNRVLAFSNLNRVPLTLEMAEDVLGDLITAKAPRQITAKVVLEATADMFGLTVDELCGKSRSRPLVTARQVAMYVLREMTDFSYPAIGRAFGDRDHTTVMHAVSKISDLMRERRTIYEQVTELMHRIRTDGRSLDARPVDAPARSLSTTGPSSPVTHVGFRLAVSPLWEAGDAAVEADIRLPPAPIAALSPIHRPYYSLSTFST